VSGTTPICIGATATYSSNGDANGTWSSSNTAVATITSGGIVSAVGAGTSTISYTVSGCNAVPATKVLTVSPNTICPAYTGIYFANTSSTTTGGSASFNLTYTITGAGCNGRSGLGVANFIVTNTADPSSTNVSYGTKAYNSNTGLLTIPVTVQLGNSVYSAGVTFTLALVSAPNYAISSTCSDPILVTVSTKADGFVTGGGYIIPTNSNGQIGTGAVNLRTNFGFNIKYNKSGTNLQGNWNMIIRTATGLWQVKSSQPTYLTITQVSPTSYKADMVFSAASIKNLTAGTAYGTATVNVTVYDNGEPGAGVDQIFIKVYDGATNYYTSSTSAVLSTPSTIPQLVQGNIQIHMLGAKAAARTASEYVIIETPKKGTVTDKNGVSMNPGSEINTALKFAATAYPNPYNDNVRFTIESNVSGHGILEVYNLLGQKIRTVFEGNVFAGKSQVVQFNVPVQYRTALMYRFGVGNKEVSGKLLRP
jgi:hypothetical protein